VGREGREIRNSFLGVKVPKQPPEWRKETFGVLSGSTVRGGGGAGGGHFSLTQEGRSGPGRMGAEVKMGGKDDCRSGTAVVPKSSIDSTIKGKALSVGPQNVRGGKDKISR